MLRTGRHMFIRSVLRLFSIALASFLSITIFFVLMIVFLYINTGPLPDLQTSHPPVLYDRNGQSFTTADQGHPSQLKNISPYLIQATIAVEDRRFYDHPGFDPRRILASLWTDLKARRFVEGASTITQQLARNLYLSHERTLTRKVLELVYALKLEATYSKDELLERYLNTIYYGAGAYGIEQAAQRYFNKPASDLNLAEAALLAGIPQSPSRINPLVDLEKARARQKVVLEAMINAGMITREKAQDALKSPLSIVSRARKSRSWAPYFRDAVLEEVQSILHLTPEELQSGGYRITTTLDQTMQKAAEDAVKRFLPSESELEVALIAIDPQDGGVRALIGGRDYEKSPFNRALKARRQPGSAFKPIVYLTALEDGMTPLTEIESRPTVFTYDGGRTYEPKNYHERYAERYITMYEAIQRSDNIYAVTTLMHVGAERVARRAQALGIREPLEKVPALALGASGVSPASLAQVYATLAAYGEKHPLHFVERIEDENGRTLYTFSERGKRVADPAHVFVLTRLLQGVFEPSPSPGEPNGTAFAIAKDIHRPIAGKTGSTPTDGWMAGYTPDLAAVVWVGYDDMRPIDERDTSESSRSKHIFASFIENALNDKPPKLFSIPDGVEMAYIPLGTDTKKGEIHCGDGTLLFFIEGTAPHTACAQNTPLVKAKEPTVEATHASWWDVLSQLFR
ncbi:MAG: penicillin-binding protein [Candidatus Carbobacillus altaicus]|nr:penicillin-binding protein [Candidatus Carbobacillus altaicus]